MKIAPMFAILFICALGLTLAQHAEAKAKWVCIKDGAEVKVKGKKPKEKEKDCTHQGGVWEKAKDENHQEEKQESGMGGAW